MGQPGNVTSSGTAWECDEQWDSLGMRRAVGQPGNVTSSGTAWEWDEQWDSLGM